MAAHPAAAADSPAPDHGDTAISPKPAPRASIMRDTAAATKAPPMTAPQETPLECSSRLGGESRKGRSFRANHAQCATHIHPLIFNRKSQSTLAAIFQNIDFMGVTHHSPVRNAKSAKFSQIMINPGTEPACHARSSALYPFSGSRRPNASMLHSDLQATGILRSFGPARASTQASPHIMEHEHRFRNQNVIWLPALVVLAALFSHRGLHRPRLGSRRIPAARRRTGDRRAKRHPHFPRMDRHARRLRQRSDQSAGQRLSAAAELRRRLLRSERATAFRDRSAPLSGGRRPGAWASLPRPMDNSRRPRLG